VVSGSIDPEDPSPEAAAWREIREETTLTQSSLELMRRGKSYVLPDKSIGREWTIYPFAFRLKEASEGGKGEDAIQLDWEHETWAWYDPFEIEDSEKFGAVPRSVPSFFQTFPSLMFFDHSRTHSPGICTR
jgi:8-oxo-dGTP pyrophosphatase MutT (NUDIX family)